MEFWGDYLSLGGREPKAESHFTLGSLFDPLSPGEKPNSQFPHQFPLLSQSSPISVEKTDMWLYSSGSKMR